MGAASQEFENWQRENRLGRFAPSNEATRGLEPRYEVTKINDPEGKHKDCRVFVLDPQHDKNARKVLLEYAALSAQDGRDQLAVDIIEWVGQIELREHHPRLAEELDAEVARLGAEVDGVSPDEAEKVSPAPEQAERKICPVHHQSDCSPLLNGCSRLTDAIHFGVQGTFTTPPIENKGGYSMSIDPTDGKRI